MENQDAYAYRRLGTGYVLAVADGAGSSRCAATGARLAVAAACDAAEQFLGRPAPDLPGWTAAGNRYVARVLGLFDHRIAALCEVDGSRPGDYATTLLCVVAYPPRYLSLSLGDGFLLSAHHGGGTHLMAPPDQGPDGGATVFLTSPHRSRSIWVRLIDDPGLCGLALCTDGLTEAVLTADQWPDGTRRLRAPADADGYFRVFRTERPDVAELTRRLQSPEFAATSPDDKTMVLAVRQ
jgi:serine/threonine protein phosphatase PrpC